MALSGLPSIVFEGAGVATAEAATASVIRISNAGPGARKAVMLFVI